MKLNFKYGGRKPKPLITISRQDIPQRYNVIGRGTHKLMTISAPAVKTTTFLGYTNSKTLKKVHNPTNKKISQFQNLKH